MGVIWGLVVDAGVLGLIVVGMEGGAFPGWAPMVACALAIGFTDGLVETLLPGVLSLLGILAGALAGAWLLTWLLGMTPKRATKATVLFVGIRFVIGLLLVAITAA